MPLLLPPPASTQERTFIGIHGNRAIRDRDQQSASFFREVGLIYMPDGARVPHNLPLGYRHERPGNPGVVDVGVSTAFLFQVPEEEE